jgi:hypothetical protein
LPPQLSSGLFVRSNPTALDQESQNPRVPNGARGFVAFVVQFSRLQ